jgi:hypothetical protein
MGARAAGLIGETGEFPALNGNHDEAAVPTRLAAAVTAIAANPVPGLCRFRQPRLSARIDKDAGLNDRQATGSHRYSRACIIGRLKRRACKEGFWLLQPDRAQRQTPKP